MNKRHAAKKLKRHPGVYKLPDGRFLIRCFATESGTNRRRDAQQTLPEGTTLSQALAALSQLKSELATGVRPEAPKQDSLFAYAEQWLEAKAARLKPSTADRYATALSKHLLPFFGDVALSTITRIEVERWVAHVERARIDDTERYAKATVQGWFRILTQLLKDAAADLNLPDPTSRVRGPTPRGVRPKREKRTLTLDELWKLLASVKEQHPDRYAEVFVLAFTGIRSGELFGLRWVDMNESRGVLTIVQSAWRKRTDTTKTEDPREVALVDELSQVLREHRTALVAQQHAGLTSGLVFPSRVGTPRVASSLAKPLAAAVKDAELTVHVTPQVLRRTFNTLMLREGVDRIVLRSQMGHCDERMTERYAGIDIRDKQAALRRLFDKHKP